MTATMSQRTVDGQHLKNSSGQGENDWDSLDQAAWREWVRASWLPSNVRGLQGEPLGEAWEEESEDEGKESWRKSKVPQHQAWI